MRPIPSTLGRNSALLTGEIEIDPSVPPSQIAKLSATPGIKAQKADGFRVMYIGFNVAYNPAMADPNFRLAVDSAVDRNAIANRLLGGLGKPAGQLPSAITFLRQLHIVLNAGGKYETLALLSDGISIRKVAIALSSSLAVPLEKL
jgi:ABC-type transport system substrate-binding protein